MSHSLPLAIVLAATSISVGAVAQLQPGDRVLVGHSYSPFDERILITEPSFASRLLAVTGLPNRGINGVAYDAASGRLYVSAGDVYELQVSGSQAIATFAGYASTYERTFFIGHNGLPIVARDSTFTRDALYEVSPTVTRPLFASPIGRFRDEICGATYDAVNRSYFVHTTPTIWPATPTLWKVDPEGNAVVLVSSFLGCANHSSLVPDGRGGVYVANGLPNDGISHVSAAGVVQPVLFPPVNQFLSAAGIERDRLYVFATDSTTYLVDLASSQIVPQWGNLTAFQNGEMTGLIAIPALCQGGASTFGSGCADRSSAILSLAAGGCATPGAGLGLHLGMGHAAPYLMLAGLSRTAWLGAALPFQLGPLGGGMCALLTSNELILGPFANTSTTASVPVPLERDPALIGRVIFVQGATLDSAANPLGIATSNGLTISIG